MDYVVGHSDSVVLFRGVEGAGQGGKWGVVGWGGWEEDGEWFGGAGDVLVEEIRDRLLILEVNIKKHSLDVTETYALRLEQRCFSHAEEEGWG